MAWLGTLSGPPLNIVMDEAMMITDGFDDQRLARDMIDVHGREAATVARGNARAAALAGQVPQARSWIKVLGMIQRQLADNASPIRATN